MTLTRDIDDISTAPGGKSGAEWTSDARLSIKALWDLTGGKLLNIAGTNSITADVDVETGFTSYTDGLVVGFVAAATNTGPCTLNLSGLGAKGLRSPDGDPLAAGGVVGGRYTEAIFDEDEDYFRLKTSGGTTNVTISGGLFLQRSEASRLAAAVSSTTTETTIGSMAFTCGFSTSRVIIEGSLTRVTAAGSPSATGTTIKLFVDGVEKDSFTDHCLASSIWSTPFYFSYLPADTSSHTYSVRVTSSLAATYPASSNVIWCSEISPNT